MAVVKQITDAIESVKGVRLLDVDPGEATNRTVVTFVGSPDDVVEAAFRGAAKLHRLLICASIMGLIREWVLPTCCR